MQWLGIGVIEWGVGFAGIAAIAAIAFIHMRAWRTGMQTSDAAFVRWAGGALGLLATLAIIYETLPIWLLPACG